jgi:hypothetical protein
MPAWLYDRTTPVACRSQSHREEQELAGVTLFDKARNNFLLAANGNFLINPGSARGKTPYFG